jgi:hypothetical protein
VAAIANNQANSTTASGNPATIRWHYRGPSINLDATQPLIGTEEALRQIFACLKPDGLFCGIVPAMDSIHYGTMLLLDRARANGLPEDKARQNAAHHGEHDLYDFAFGDFRFRGLHQHFWQPFEVRYRLRRAGFTNARLSKVHLPWDQFACAKELAFNPPPWDWFFTARRPGKK